MRILLILLFLLAISSVNSLQIDEGTIIQPNSSSNGYYIINKTAYLSELEVNSTHANFMVLDQKNRTAVILDSSGNIIETLCVNMQNCSIPQISTIKNLLLKSDNYPIWSNQSQSRDKIYIEDEDRINNLSVTLTDDVNLSIAILSTNECGVWKNKTVKSLSGTIQTIIFLWQNDTVEDAWVTWKIYFNDSIGSENVTNSMAFKVEHYRTGTPTTVEGGGAMSGENILTTSTTSTIKIPPLAIINTTTIGNITDFEKIIGYATLIDENNNIKETGLVFWACVLIILIIANKKRKKWLKKNEEKKKKKIEEEKKKPKVEEVYVRG